MSKDALPANVSTKLQLDDPNNSLFDSLVAKLKQTIPLMHIKENQDLKWEGYHKGKTRLFVEKKFKMHSACHGCSNSWSSINGLVHLYFTAKKASD